MLLLKVHVILDGLINIAATLVFLHVILFLVHQLKSNNKELLSCQPRVTVTSCSVYKVISDLESIDHLCINPIRRIIII